MTIKKILKKIFVSKKNKPKNGKKEYSYNILSKVEYWSDSRIQFTTSKINILQDHSILLIQRKELLTQNEIEIQRKIEKNEPRHYSLTDRNLFRVQFNDKPKMVKSVRKELTRLIDRMRQPEFDVISQFRYIVSINQKYSFSTLLRSLSTDGLSISIYTPDFDISEIVDDQSVADIIIAPSNNFVKGGKHVIRRFIKASSPAECYHALLDVLDEFSPKDFKILAPIYGTTNTNDMIDPDNLDNFDIVVLMSCERDAVAPIVGNFRTFIEVFSSDIRAVLCTEPMIYRYKDLLTDFPHTLPKFLELSLQDGARIDVRYENNRTHI